MKNVLRVARGDINYLRRTLLENRSLKEPTIVYIYQNNNNKNLTAWSSERQDEIMSDMHFKFVEELSLIRTRLGPKLSVV